MTPALVTALCSGIAGIIAAVTALVTALKAHGRINSMQRPGSPGGPPSSRPGPPA